MAKNGRPKRPSAGDPLGPGDKITPGYLADIMGRGGDAMQDPRFLDRMGRLIKDGELPPDDLSPEQRAERLRHRRGDFGQDTSGRGR